MTPAGVLSGCKFLTDELPFGGWIVAVVAVVAVVAGVATVAAAAAAVLTPVAPFTGWLTGVATLVGCITGVDALAGCVVLTAEAAFGGWVCDGAGVRRPAGSPGSAVTVTVTVALPSVGAAECDSAPLSRPVVRAATTPKPINIRVASHTHGSRDEEGDRPPPRRERAAPPELPEPPDVLALAEPPDLPGLRGERPERWRARPEVWGTPTDYRRERAVRNARECYKRFTTSAPDRVTRPHF